MLRFATLALVAVLLCAQSRVHPVQIQGVVQAAPNPIQVKRVSDTELAVGANCTPAAPCMIRLSQLTAVVDKPWVVRLLGAGDGDVRIYLGWDGVLYAAPDPPLLAVWCGLGPTQCRISAIAYRADSYPIVEWRVAAGKWHAQGMAVALPIVAYAVNGAAIPLEPLSPIPGSRCTAPRLALGQERIFVCYAGRWFWAALQPW